jgi:hypothetical protein
MHELRPILVSEREDDGDPACNAVTTAEREFEAFTKAVTGLFGPEQARLSAEDWLNELASRDSLPGLRSLEWRLVTVAALARLTIRMTVGLMYPSASRSSNR